MMREIKFRAFGGVEPCMHYMDTKSDMGTLKDLQETESWKVMQYTGLKDKEGKEIYEGDIYYQGDKNIKYEVIFNDASFVGRQIGNRSLAGLTYFQDSIKKIGNIHENPELIKEE